MSYYKANNDPKVVGPGIWAMIHPIAKEAKTRNEKREASVLIKRLISYMRCQKCKTHAGSYMEKHPFTNAINSNDPLSLFKWTVDFHNTVNRFLEKPQFSYIDALKEWDENEICLEDCGQEKIKEEKIKREKALEYVLTSY